MRRFAVVALALFITLPAVAQKRRAASLTEAPPPPRDIFSAAQPADVRTTHLILDLDVDFDARVVRGSATHRIANLTGTRKFVVDTRNLEIESVTIDGTETTWSLATSTAIGRPLTIDIEPSTRFVRIAYRSTANSRALNWLTPRQTLGNVAPFLFTMSQPDHARSWIPIQDTPGIRMTYEATIRVPPGMLALMSAPNPRAPSADGVYVFQMGRPIAPYLIALAVGHLEFHALGERTGFYAEPVVVPDALWDLQYLPRMFDVAERILGNYPFERYDLLLAPPGFTAGGMENPMLNFVNVVGVVSFNRDSPPHPSGVVAHELAHSWGGDLVTCATWSDMWLNEGFATYFQKRIDEEMVDGEYAELGYYFDRRSYTDYMNSVALRPQLTTLHRQFAPGDTLTVFSTTNYQKGSLFLKTLEDHIGREPFDVFLRDYFRKFAYRWVDAGAFVAALGPVDESLLVQQWVFAPGLPNNVTAPLRSRIWDRVGVQAAAFRSGASAESLDTTGWRSLELTLFLWQITDLIAQRMPELDEKFGLSQKNRAPMDWMLAVCSTMYEPGLPGLERFLLLGPFDVVALYDRLSKTPAGLAYALEIYKVARERYAPGLQSYVDGLLKYTPAALRTAA